MNIYLLGYRGTGKSTVGRFLAESLGREFVDTDEEICRRAGREVSEVFAERGESGFRDLEAEVVAAVAARRHLVVALGGGAVLREDSCQILQETGRLIWLRAAVDTVIHRLASDAQTERSRPPLTDLSPREEVERLMSERRPRYDACADFAVDTDDRTPAEVARLVSSWIEGGEGAAEEDGSSKSDS